MYLKLLKQTLPKPKLELLIMLHQRFGEKINMIQKQIYGL